MSPELANALEIIERVRAEDEPDPCTAELWALYAEIGQELTREQGLDAELVAELVERTIAIGSQRDAQHRSAWLRRWFR